MNEIKKKTWIWISWTKKKTRKIPKKIPLSAKQPEKKTRSATHTHYSLTVIQWKLFEKNHRKKNRNQNYNIWSHIHTDVCVYVCLILELTNLILKNKKNRCLCRLSSLLYIHRERKFLEFAVVITNNKKCKSEKKNHSKVAMNICFKFKLKI